MLSEIYSLKWVINEHGKHFMMQISILELNVIFPLRSLFLFFFSSALSDSVYQLGIFFLPLSSWCRLSWSWNYFLSELVFLTFLFTIVLWNCSLLGDLVNTSSNIFILIILWGMHDCFSSVYWRFSFHLASCLGLLYWYLHW